MCCCGKPTINGEPGYRWNTPDGPTSVYPVNPPHVYIKEGEKILYDEPGRCGGLDSHSHHYRVIRGRAGGLMLLVRHGGGEERIRLSCDRTLTGPLAAMDSNARYWLLNAIYHAQSEAARAAREAEAARWRQAAADKRIKTRKRRGGGWNSAVKVWIEPAGKGEVQS